MSKDKLHVKLLFEKEQVQMKYRFISGLNMYFGTRGFLYLTFLFDVQKNR
jgi:hypothetical protein